MEPTNINQNTAKQGFDWSDFFTFRKMITLQIIQIVYVVVAIVITLGGLMSMFAGGGNSYSSSMLPGGPFVGLLIIVFGNIGWRMWCELIIVFFRINKTLTDIDNNTKK
ncbi:MAG: DUF4282 domain-containing protein [Bacteroidota bacterium]